MQEHDREWEKSFKNPPAKYRGAPFWAWNGVLDQEILKKQIDDFEKMGFGGFHIHSRIGLATEYLGEEFMNHVKFCHDYASAKGMLTYLYDEDKWPSGYGGGRVTKKKEYHAKYVLFSPNYHENGHYKRNLVPSCRLTEDGDIKWIASYEIELSEGKLVDYSRAEKQEGDNIWHAYIVVTDSLPWFNEEAYVDTLNPEAIKTFTELGYEPYNRAVGEHFSKTIPSIFTDEPQFIKYQNFEDGRRKEEIGIPYSDDFQDEFLHRYQKSLLECLPEIFWENANGQAATVRYQYLNLLSDRFAESYVKTLSDWCEEHNIMLTGHLMEEGALEKQIRSVGDTMRSYQFFHKAGIDILADLHEYTTAKQAQSVSRQMGKPGLTSELYGVTNWNFDFRGHKLQGDWQAALGVTTRVPHLSWMYMGGESKRDYPAPIDAHSPWYERYFIIEDYFGRINSIMERGKSEVEIGVIHPIESMFIALGPDSDTICLRNRMEEQFQELTKWLLFNLLDFDFISEKLITELPIKAENGKLHIGHMAYRTVIVPPLLTIRSTTLKHLEEFSKQGGCVIVMGDLPSCIDGKNSEQANKLLEKSTRIGFDKDALLKNLEDVRIIDVTDIRGIRHKNLIYQIRSENDNKWLFLAHGAREEHREYSLKNTIEERQKIIITLEGQYEVLILDAMTGEYKEADYEAINDKTRIFTDFWPEDSMLLKLKHLSTTHKRVNNMEEREEFHLEYLPSVCKYHLEEPNALVLDMAEYSLDGGAWMGEEEILRIDDIARLQFGKRIRTDSFPQPWISQEGNSKEHVVDLRFSIESNVEGVIVELAFEGDHDCRILFNGNEVNIITNETYIDEAIKRIPLGTLRKGQNTLEYRTSFGTLTNLEWFYLLGQFGVRVYGNRKIIEELPQTIGFGDYSVQGLPFYGGNICYQASIRTKAGHAMLEVSEYEAPLIEVEIDGKKPVPIITAPYMADLGWLEEGEHKLVIRSYGSRVNMFGQLHNCNLAEAYFGPKTWRTKGQNWCYEYRLHSCGIKKAPIIYTSVVK